MNVSHKVLPAGWAYVIPMRRIKSFAREQTADIRAIEFSGTAGKPVYSWSAARFVSRVVDDEMVFRIILHGIPEAVLALADCDISAHTFSALESFLLQSTQPFDATTPPQIGFVSLREHNEKLEFTYNASNSDKRKLPVIPWW